MSALPALFVSHGAPTLALQDGPAHRFLQGALDAVAKPTGIVVVSAHWESRTPLLSTAEKPETIYDFGGFDPRLRTIRYGAPGAPELARQAAELLRKAGFAADLDRDRGLDHGAWVPMFLMRPQADIPVTQLSIQPHLDAAHHYAVGKALRSLRSQGVLILASGSLTHNLYEFFGRPVDGAPAAWAATFADWVGEQAARRDRAALLDMQDRAPQFARNHPSDEHLLPFFVGLGAGGDAGDIERLHASFTHGVLAMDAYAFH